MSLSEKVKRHRLELGLTQKSLAEQVNLRKTMISEVECGRKKLSVNSLKKIAKVFNCTIDELVN